MFFIEAPQLFSYFPQVYYKKLLKVIALILLQWKHLGFQVIMALTSADHNIKKKPTEEIVSLPHQWREVVAPIDSFDSDSHEVKPEREKSTCTMLLWKNTEKILQRNTHGFLQAFPHIKTRCFNSPSIAILSILIRSRYYMICPKYSHEIDRWEL